MHNSAIRRCSRGTHQHYPQSSEAAKDVVAHSAIKVKNLDAWNLLP